MSLVEKSQQFLPSPNNHLIILNQSLPTLIPQNLLKTLCRAFQKARFYLRYLFFSHFILQNLGRPEHNQWGSVDRSQDCYSNQEAEWNIRWSPSSTRNNHALFITGISIVGGRVEMTQSQEPETRKTMVTGIFIKSVIKESPAGHSGQIFMGDRILSVWIKNNSTNFIHF